MREKIKELQMLKRKPFQVLLLIELVLLLAGVPGLFGKNNVYEYGQENMCVNFGSLDPETGVCYVDESFGQNGDMADFVNISLNRGVYDVQLRYTSDTSMKNYCNVSAGTAGYKGMLTNGENCYPEIGTTDFRMWLLEDAAGISVHALYGGEGSFSVEGLTLRETNALSRIWIFCVLAGALAVNLCCLYISYDRQFGISAKDKTIHFILALTVLFSSMPLMADYIANSGDLVYHLMRVEGIKDSILYGQFPNRIAPEWQQGYGYASPVFYGETVLYIMALFRLIGFTVLSSYRIFFFLLNIATVLISYHCFRKIFEEKYIGLLCGVLYSVCVYRIFKTFFTGGFGESIALTFLPVLVYGFYRVFTQDPESRDYKKSWVPLTIGFSGLLQSHLLTGELAGLFTILLCLVLIKKVFQKQTFLVLAKTVIYSCLFSAWFLVPFLDYMLTGNFVIHNVSERTIQSRGLYPAHLLFAFSISGSNTLYEHTGMYDSQCTNLGLALTAALFLWAGLRFFRRTKVLDRKELALGRITAWFAVISMCMSLYFFPWDRIQSINGLTASLVSSLQFPSRMLSIASIMLVTLAGVTAKCISKQYGRTGELVFAGAAVVMILVSNIWLLTYMTYDMEGVYLYNEEGMGSGYVSGGEYLPYGADTSQYVHRAPEALGGVSIAGYEKTGLTVDVECTSSGTEPGELVQPLLYYKGYQAWDTETKQEFPVESGDNFLVTVKLPAGYQGTVRTAFVSPVYWRAAEGISLAAVCLAAAAGYLRKRRKGAE